MHVFLVLKYTILEVKVTLCGDNKVAVNSSTLRKMYLMILILLCDLLF